MKLPLRLDADVTSECWTFYRMAVTGAYPQMESWLINHLNQLFIDPHCEIHYGFYGRKYNPYYAYEEVIETREKPLKELPDGRSFINYVIRCLEDGCYPLVEFDFHTLFDEEGTEEPNIHELLLYGFDEKGFWFPNLEKGRWVERHAPFDKMAAAFLLRKNMGAEKEQRQFWRRLYLYPFTLLRPRLDFAEPVNLYEFKNDLDAILSNACIRCDRIQEEKQSAGDYYNGILAIYNRMLLLAADIKEGNFLKQENVYNLALNTKRLYEYNSLFVKRIQPLRKRIELPCFGTLQAELDDLRERSQGIYLMAIKYRRTRSVRDLDQMKDLIYFAFCIQNGIIRKVRDELEQYLLAGPADISAQTV